MLFLCKHMLELCMTVALLFRVYCSFAFFRKPCQVKRISTFAHSAAYQCQFQNSGPIRRPWRQGKHHKLLFTVATVLFDGSMAEEAFCAALFLKPFLSTASCSFRRKDVWSKLMIKMNDEKLFELWSTSVLTLKWIWISLNSNLASLAALRIRFNPHS